MGFDICSYRPGALIMGIETDEGAQRMMAELTAVEEREDEATLRSSKVIVMLLKSCGESGDGPRTQ